MKSETTNQIYTADPTRVFADPHSFGKKRSKKM